jgi:hypothetical protein
MQVSAVAALRIALVAFVLAWLLGPSELRTTVPVWLPFLVALVLELQFFLGARDGEAVPVGTTDRLPQDVDRERFGYPDEPEELLLVREGGRELWIPYSGETGEEFEELLLEAREGGGVGTDQPVLRAADPGRAAALRRLLAGLAVIAALVAVVWVAESRRGWDGVSEDDRIATEDRISDEASRIAGHGVEVRCDERGEFVGAVQHADGVAVVGGQIAYLTPERCFDLYRLALKGETSFSQTARSVAVLAHEAWHLRGVRDEGTTECYALQSGVELGRRLGLSEGTARRMMRQQLAENRLRRGAGAEYLVTDECANGGRLDLHPQSSSFP